VSCRSINRLARKAKSDVQSRRPYPICRGFIIASTPQPGRTLREPTMGRSSGSRINLQATPSHGFRWPQWPMWRSSPVTAAGPQRICTVFPLLRIWISFPDRHPRRAQSYQDKLGRQATRSFSTRGVPGTAYASSLSSAGVPNTACTSSLLFPRPGAPRLARIQGAFASAGRIGLERHPVASSFSLIANAEPLEMSKSQ
jgi:hypothetical protein